jgi:hypothetical protein
MIILRGNISMPRMSAPGHSATCSDVRVTSGLAQQADLAAPGADQLFEIRLEPASGSPTGRPTGPVPFKGTTAQALRAARGRQAYRAFPRRTRPSIFAAIA